MIPKEYKDFNLFARDQKVSGSQLDYYNKQIENSLTPYILEERQMNVTVMDVFSRLMMERIIWVAGPVNDNMSTIVQAQLMFLDSIDNNDITMHIDTPGGSVKSGLSMVDVMDYIDSDIQTINTGMAASMGSILLGDYCGKPAEVVMKDASRDMWLSADEALKYGIIDKVVKKKK